MVINSSCVCPGETYTAVIGACASVGDAAQAEVEQGRICNGAGELTEVRLHLGFIVRKNGMSNFVTISDIN
jgi:hypothetical protein